MMRTNYEMDAKDEEHRREMGKDWVLIEEEVMKFGLVNLKMMDTIITDEENIEKSFKVRIISEEDCSHQVEQVYKKYKKIDEEVMEREDAEIARYVEAHEQA